MKVLIPAFVSLWLFLALQAQAETPAETSPEPLSGGKCLECHLRTDEELGGLWKVDVHAQAGLGCTACHGGDPEVDDNLLSKRSASGFKGRLAPKDIVAICGGCHSDATYMKTHNPMLRVDQLNEYRTSRHGELLAKGETKVATCASCHGAHGVLEVNDGKSPAYATNVPKTCGRCHGDADYMEEFGIPTDQYEEYVGSVHGKALLKKKDVRGAPACNDCHGNHGAVPPSVDAISNICGACHAYNAELFLASPLAPAFQEKSLADCVACHGKHRIIHASDDWLGDKKGTVCIKCHKKGDEGATLAVYLSETLADVRSSHDEIEESLKSAEVKGVDVTEGEDSLQAAHQALMQTRTLIHSFSKPVIEDKIREIETNYEEARQVAAGAHEEFTSRRRGLAISTLLLLLLTIGVGVKIRTLPSF